MNHKTVFGLFLAAAAAQLAVPAGMILRHENTLASGRAYKLRTAPVDPYDAFRGRYVALGYAGTAAPVRRGDELTYRQVAYARIEQGADGFGRFVQLSAAPPAGADYVRVECTWGTPTNMNFSLPFDRYFMEENAAPKAEQAYWRHGNRRGQTNDQTYVVVRIKGGRGVIEDLYIRDRPVREFLREQADKP